MTEREQLKLATKRSLQQTHISQASGSDAYKGTGTIPGVPDVPTEESDEDISWKSSDEGEDNNEQGSDDQSDNDAQDDDDDQDDDENKDDDNDQEEGDDDDDDQKEETRDEERFDPIPKIAKNTNDEGNGEENLGLNVGREEEQDEKDDKDEIYRDVNINLEGRGVQMVDVHTTQEFKDSYVNLTLVNPDGQQQNEEPSAGSDRGSKRQREGKKPESASTLKEKATRSTGKSTQGSKSRQTSTSESATAEEPMQTTHDIEEPSHPEFETCADDQPIAEPSKHPEWFSQQKKPPTLDRDWNKTFSATHGSIQLWISELAKQTDSRSSFNELMDTPVYFSAFQMNRLKVDTLTSELLAGPTYKLMKGSCKSLFYGFAVNRESARDVYSKRRIITVTELKIVEWLRIQDIEDMLLLLVQGKLRNLTVKERFAFDVSLRMFTRSIVIQRRVEDLQLGVESYQKKLNLTRPDTYHSDLNRKEAYTAYSNPRGFIYQNKDKQNMLMWIDELQKFSDATLTDVCTALDD
nr:hypothetical protein [Tanacetum cinerariifolium]